MLRFWPVWVLLLGGLLFWGLQRPDPEVLGSVRVGRPAPTFSLPVLAPYRDRFGPELGVGETLEKPVFLNIWASWCIPCRTEAPLLESFYRRYQDQVLVLGVNVQDREEEALKFIAQYGLSFPSVYDARGRIGIEYGYTGVPETFIISKERKVLARHIGELSESKLQEYLQQVRP
ncbi:MAG: redoxin domain-containing protein [Meiothermus sp.]|uniref:TlpA family protein disulfide reductase n=1 Tax=Meiothermus sp. TaxID=1955249 RepID=UPI0025F0188E|nr:redoxin domain-containing protein [Meiothermus sp.]MCS7058599.1 redoxin domain-containing protein [Meiothermus sp.]MCS7193780.1 redoxin domain-containing protein [Meiothermus sp.]MCX7739663.1 redoxin domain-containing protein [Meiothermus sp.]MDW8091628.1 redoxin domain-containing protein [Meiothermus sp.]MDW8481944.1 redoxin domain-containing protein [Meiothermus sp.]